MLSDDRKELVACLAQLSNDNYGGKKGKKRKENWCNMNIEYWVKSKAMKIPILISIQCNKRQTTILIHLGCSLDTLNIIMKTKIVVCVKIRATKLYSVSWLIYIQLQITWNDN